MREPWQINQKELYATFERGLSACIRNTNVIIHVRYKKGLVRDISLEIVEDAAGPGLEKY